MTGVTFPASRSFFRASKSSCFTNNVTWRILSDWMLMVNERHLEAVLRECCLHYNVERPHRSRLTVAI